MEKQYTTEVCELQGYNNGCASAKFSLQELRKIDFNTTDIFKFIVIMLEKLVSRRTIKTK
jgi:hypothetical protein